MKTNILLISEQLPYFRAIARRSLPTRYQHLAEDLAQDAILKAIEKVDKYNPTKGNFKSWLYRLTQNLCFDAVRRMDRMQIIPINGSGFQDFVDVSKDVDRSEMRKIRKALTFLSNRDKMLITYRLIFELSGKEMAQLTGIPEAQINVYFKRAKDRLIELCRNEAA